jgi:hypothetical protein
MDLHLNIPDPLYAEIAQAAAASGQTVERMVVERLAVDFGDELPDGFWTSDRLAQLAAADAEIDAGEFFTSDQVKEHFAQKLAASTQSHPH